MGGALGRSSLGAMSLHRLIVPGTRYKQKMPRNPLKYRDRGRKAGGGDLE